MAETPDSTFDWREKGAQVKDRDYIVQEAMRLADISLGHPQDSFNYPDVGHWNPPTSQTASIGLCDGHLAIAGLGHLEPAGKEYQAGDAIWQWLALPFGQTILAKRKANQKVEIPRSQLPGPRQEARPDIRRRVSGSPSPLVAPPELGFTANQTRQATQDERRDSLPKGDDIDAWTTAVIQSNFDNQILGRLFNRCIEYSGTIEPAIAFAAIIAKAKLTRQRRRK